MKIIRVATAEQGAEIAAELFVEAADSYPRDPVGLATGGTMAGVYRHLAKTGFTPRCSEAFALDEYFGIPDTHENSYANELNREFSKGLGWNGTIHTPGQGPYAGLHGPEKFEQTIQELGPLSVQLLGLGVNGHIAFNEPGSPFDSKTRVVDLEPSTIQANSVYFADPAEVPNQATSQGLATIAQAKKLILIVFGSAKQAALTKALHSPDETTPLAALNQHSNITLITYLET